jgi:enterochelin esterase-like enzyme
VKGTWLGFLIVLLSLGLGACSSNVSSPNAASVSMNLPTRTLTATEQPAPSITPRPSNSPTPTPTTSTTPTPTRTSPPTPLACWGRGGQIVKGQLQSDLLRLPLEFRVYLPPCYHQQKDRRYPVLYLIHGQSYNDDQWDRLGADETADRLIGAGEVSPFLIVMPRDRVWSQPTEDMFGQVVAQELVPWIDEHYRTLAGRSNRAVGGLSRGAGWALHFGVMNGDLFGAIGLHSLPVFWTDLPEIRRWVDSIEPQQAPRITIDIGEKDRPQIMKSTLWFEGLLTEKGIPHEWHLFPGYHEEAYWEAHVEAYLRWYAQEW